MYIGNMKYMYIVHGIVDKYNNVYHKTIKMKPDNIKSSTYIDVEHNEQDTKSKVGDH